MCVCVCACVYKIRAQKRERREKERKKMNLMILQRIDPTWEEKERSEKVSSPPNTNTVLLHTSMKCPTIALSLSLICHIKPNHLHTNTRQSLHTSLLPNPIFTSFYDYIHIYIEKPWGHDTALSHTTIDPEILTSFY